MSWGDPWASVEDVDPDPQRLEGLLELLNAQAALLVSVGTGGPQIDQVNAKYMRRRRQLNTALKAP